MSEQPTYKPVPTSLAWFMFAMLAIVGGCMVGTNFYIIGQLSTGMSESNLIDLNRADAADLVPLAGFDAVLAERIVADRRKNGDYCSPDEVAARVEGVGPERAAVLGQHCSFLRRCP